MANINNLFNFCDKLEYSENVLFKIGNHVGNTNILLAIKHSDNRILTYSNEWLYMLNIYHYPQFGYYPMIVNFYNEMLHKTNVQVIDADVISFITVFCMGTIHGYSGFYYILTEYLKNIEKYKHLHIIIYKNSQKGMLDIIEHLVNKNIIDRNKVIYLEKNITYHFHSITIIPNNFHGIDYPLTEEVTKFIDKYIAIDRLNVEYYKTLNLPIQLDNICIIKNSSSVALTGDGSFPLSSVNNLCNKWNLTLIEPGHLHEICLIHCVHQCKRLIISWGSTFQKNSCYISENCEKIIVLILEDSAFLGQYYSLRDTNALIMKYRNATIDYKIVNSNIDIQLL